MEVMIAELKRDVIRLYDTVEKLQKQYDILDAKVDNQYEMAKSIALMAQSMDQIQKDVGKMGSEIQDVKKRLGGLTDKDAKAWSDFKWILVVGVTGSVLGYLMGILLGG